LFRPKSKQKTIFDHDVYLPAEKVQALEKTWAGPFRRVLPMIDEEPFRQFYCPDTGRPNVPVAILTGLCVLKEMHELTDQEVLGSLEFDLRWQYAFDLNALEAHICQKTLHTFRTLVTTNNKAKEIFTGTTDKIITTAGLSTEKQRLDSTHIISNMAELSRLGLFVLTIEGFLRRLAKKHPNLYKKLPAVYDKVYRQRSGYFADVKSSRAKRRLAKCARHLFDLVDRFRGHQETTRMKSYQLMARLLEEHVAGDSAHASDQHDVEPTIERLEAAGHKPGELFADAGYGSGENIVQAQEQGVELTAPITSGKAPDSNKMQLSDFEVTADCKQLLCCIKGHAPLSCKLTGGGKAVVALFAAAHCSECEFLPICLVKRRKGGSYRLRYRRKDMATSRRRQEQDADDFKERYRIRSGIEATISEADRVTGLKRVWTRGKHRVTMSVYMKALAINIKRYVQSELEKAKKAISYSCNRTFVAVLRCLCPLS
jgi:hypothetical protein